MFDLLYGANLKEVGNDTLSGYNVNTVALQIPTRHLVTGHDPVIGVNSTCRGSPRPAPTRRCRGSGARW